jgi:hypothetical protein
MSQKPILFCISFLFSCSICWSQNICLTKADIARLHFTILTDYIRAHETNMTNRKSEFILLFLETDSNSRVKNLHLMTDEKNKDSVYNILSRMKPEDFKEWKPKNCKNKVVIIPISAGGTNESNNYTDILWRDYLYPNSNPKKFPGAWENKQVIVTNTLSYSPPIPIVEHPVEGKLITIEEEKKIKQ